MARLLRSARCASTDSSSSEDDSSGSSLFRGPSTLERGRTDVTASLSETEPSRAMSDVVLPVAEMLAHIEGLQRKKTAALLFFGSFFGFLGFCFAWLIGLMQFVKPQLTDYLHAGNFGSGKGYFPSTVSEMVHDPDRPAGKCFFAFEFIAAVFIFQSWYPWHLRNVYIGDDPVIPYTNLSWMMFRQLVPATGMMVVATVTSTPSPHATPLDWVCIYIHLTGAIMLFGGYWLVEAYTLGWGGLVRMPKVAKQTIHGNELLVRKLLATSILVFYLLFLGFQGLLLLPLRAVGGHCDDWKMGTVNTTMLIDEDHLELATQEVLLVDTADGFVLWVKVASYVSEVCCGFALLASLLSIWWFCDERHADLREGLWKMLPSDGSLPNSPNDRELP